MTVFYRLFKLFIFVIITPLFVTGVFLFYYQNYNKTQILNNYLNIAQISSKFIQQNIENASLRLSFSQDLFNMLDDGKPGAQQRLDEAVEDNPDFVFLAMLDKDGREILRAGTPQMLKLIGPLDLSGDKSIKEIGAQSMAISGFSDGLAFPFVEVVYPAGEGRFVFAVMSLFNIWDKLATQRIGISGGIYFATPNHGLLDVDSQPLPPISAGVLGADLLSDKKIFKEIKATTGDIFVGAASPTVIPDTYIFVLQFRREAFYTISLISWLIAFFILATTTLSYFAALSFSEEISSPIEALTKAARKIGENDFDVEVSARDSWGEFDILIEAFNAMASKLGEYKAVQLDKLLDEKRKIDLLAGLMRDGIVMATLEGEQLFANRTAQQILDSDALCSRLECTLHGKELKPELQAITKLPSGTVFSYRKGDKTAYFEMISETFKPAKEDGVILMVFRDITTEREVSEMKNDIFNSVAHDLRAPLLGLQAYLMVLKEGVLNEAEQARALTAMENSSKTLAGLVENILDISKLERGLLMVNRAPFNIAQSVERVFSSIMPLAEAKNTRLVNHIPQSLTVNADGALLERVFMNLISNSIKFTEGGTITAAFKEEDNKYILSITDTGAGIEPEHLTKIFMKYHQVDKNVKGYGLGLAIVRQIIKAHGGEIWASNNPQGGAVMTFSLPKEEQL